jgi:hypothetical protein
LLESGLPYQLANKPRKHKADCEQRDGNPKWRPVAFTYPVHDCNDQRDQRASKRNQGDHKALPSLIANGITS